MDNQVLNRIRNGEVLIISSRRRGGLILRKPYYSQFVGPGGAVGGKLDLDCDRLIPVGKLALVAPHHGDDLYRAYLIRRQWILNIHHITQYTNSDERAERLVNQLEHYFDSETIAKIAPEDLAVMIGTFTATVEKIMPH